MNTTDTGHTGANLLIYAMTMMGTFLTDEWYLVIMVVFGFVHVYVAWKRNGRENELHEAKIESLKNGNTL